MRINKFWSKYALLSVLITALLAMQWTTTHIHLAESHDHQGRQHQHQTETHVQHLDVSSTSLLKHSQSHSNAVEFDTVYSCQKRELQKTPITLLNPSDHQWSSDALAIFIKIPAISRAQRRYLDHSTVNTRAPPLNA